jgi:hypothetical protein
MNKTLRNALFVTLTSIFLMACGGGGGGTGGSTGGGTGGGTGGSNVAPVLSKPTSVTMDENTTTTVTLSATDSNGDTLSYSVQGNDTVTANINNRTLTLTANEVATTTTVIVTATVSDGSLTDSEDISVTVNNVIVNTAPVVELDLAEFTLTKGQNKEVTSTITDAENDPFTITLGTSDSSVISVIDTSTGFEVTALNEGIAIVTYTVTDSGNLSTVSQVTVIVEEAINFAPDFTLLNENNQIVSVFHNREVTINVDIVDPDSDSHTLVMTSFEASNGDISLIESYNIDSTNKTLTFDINSLPSNIENMTFDMVLRVTDSSDNEVTKYYELFVEKSENTPPLFTFSEKVGAFVMVGQDATTEITYTIEDDNASIVNVTGVEYWYGDQEKFNVTLDSENKKITITTTNAEIEDAYGFVLKYTDSSISGNVNVELLVTATFGAEEQQMLDLRNKMIKARESVKEYVYIGAFYSQVLENLGFITEQQAEDFVERLDVDDSEGSQYSIFNLYIGNIDFYISRGNFKDEGFRDSYITVLNNLFEMSKTVGQYRYEIINQMATISGDLLPAFTFEGSVEEYDSTNNYYSRFVGNALYGEYVNEVWVFNEEFLFMDAVLAQMVENAQRNIGS